MKNNLNIIDLFAGCGGLSDGFKQTGSYNTIALVEWEKAPCKTLTHRLKDKWKYKNAENIVLNFDIQRTKELLNGWKNDEKFGTHIGLKKLVKASGKNVDVVIGGPPCQAYSIAGRIRDEKGMNDDYRNFLFESYLNVVKEFKPKLFVFENVPGILSARPGGISIIERITKNFKDAGYIISDNLKEDALIHCTEFGVPQARKRMVIIGVKKSEVTGDPQEALKKFYKEILPTYKANKIKTVADAISDLPKLYPLNNVETSKGRKFSHKFDTEVINHVPRFHSDRDIEVFEELTIDIEKKKFKYATSQSLIELYYKKTGKKTNVHKYHVLKWDKPSNTIPAHLYKDGLRHIHPDSKQSRSITVREAGRLQSFDDDFQFYGSMGDQFKMIGNAVPPQFAKAIGLAVNEFINKYFKK